MVMVELFYRTFYRTSPKYLFFLLIFFGRSKEFVYICSRLSQPSAAGGSKTSVAIQRLTKPFVGLAKGKGVYGRYRSVLSNFAI